jgi:4-hydroxybenzoate polyprenyltransferase
LATPASSASADYKPNAFHFFVYSNLFIAVCAMLMVYQTSVLILHTLPDLRVMAFIFFSTICSYSFHWYLTPAVDLPSSRLQWLKRNHSTHLIFFFTALAGVAFYGALLIEHWFWLLVSAAVTFLYSAPKIPLPLFRILRKVALGKTVFLAFVWAYVTTCLPVQISGEPWRNEIYLFGASRFFLIYAICILFDYRDREYDKSIGIRSLITWMSQKSITILFTVTIVLFAISTIWLGWHGHYSNMTTILLLIPGIIVAALYHYATKNYSDILYYFVLDGMMALSGLLMLITDVFVNNFLFIPFS